MMERKLAVITGADGGKRRPCRIAAAGSQIVWDERVGG